MMDWIKFKPPINFVTIHYAYIVFMGLLSLAILYPAGNLTAVDAYFFGASASTESGLNTIDVKDLYTYQQLYIYFIPTLTNLGFINAFTVLVRLIWFRKHLKKVAPQLLGRHERTQSASQGADVGPGQLPLGVTPTPKVEQVTPTNIDPDPEATTALHISFDPHATAPRSDSPLFVPGPRDFEQGHTPTKLEHASGYLQDDDISSCRDKEAALSVSDLRMRHAGNSRHSISRQTESIAGIAKSILVLNSSGASRSRLSLAADPTHNYKRHSAMSDGLALSRHATIGRNSNFHNLTEDDRVRIGGIEYRSLQLLLRIVFPYFIILHLVGVIFLIGWIKCTDVKYRDYLDDLGQSHTWWAFYSAQTMVNNLGFTLTPDSMITFRDAPWPMIAMSFLAFAGNTFYPICLRFIIWVLSKVAPKRARIQEPLSFLLNHPRRCYTLLFPSRPTWILCGILVALNFVDTLLIIILDLDNPEVNALPVGQRILAAVFQSASSRHTGTATFNLANVSPAVQFSLMVMMYISIFPIALSMRVSNTYEEKSLGIWSHEGNLDETHGRSYIMTHLQNQLNFDLWYIFLGIFVICIAESKRIADVQEPAFTVWTVFFEVTSAYGNVGLSLGYPTVMTSLSGMFGTFSKLVICAMMIRGRHRGLPYTLDRAIMLPDEGILEDLPPDNKAF